jgi:hypothetical protein
MFIYDLGYIVRWKRICVEKRLIDPLCFSLARDVLELKLFF